MNAVSPLLAAYAAAGATAGEVYGMTTGLVLAPTAGALLLADLTPLPKWLLLGSAARPALTAAGRAVPVLMQALGGAAGAFTACRAPRQYLVCAGDDGVPPPALCTASCALRYDCVDLALGGGSGEHGVEDLLAEACPTDLAAFAVGAWVPTLMFGVEVGLWRVAQRSWRVIAAPADGEFLVATLLDALRARHGALTGYRDYLTMNSFDG